MNALGGLLKRWPGFSPLDRNFALLAARLAGGAPEVALAAALVSRETETGGACIDLEAVLASPPDGIGAADVPADVATWERALLAAPRAVTTPGGYAPLVLDGRRLYLHRMWRHEENLAAGLLRLAADEPPVDDGRLAGGLERLFGPSGGDDDQRLAAATAVMHRLAVISGGPGTGKTHTVLRVLALLAEQSLGADRSAPAMALAAPTGKAAARLQEMVGRNRPLLKLEPSLEEIIPREAQTIHRLLGGGRSTGFRHHQENPLPFDVVVVDEASMIDLTLMARLVAALKAGSRLILLGDKDQLASVEAGRVLGDLCAGMGRRSAGFRERLARIAGLAVPGGGEGEPLADCLSLLVKNRRFIEGSAIGALARAINEGMEKEASRILHEGGGAVLLRETAGGVISRDEVRRLGEAFGPYLEQVRAGAPPGEILDALDGFRVLTALRVGPAGAEGLNRRLEESLALSTTGGASYPGRPVMVTENDYTLDLFNGDTGVLLPDERAGGELRAFFRDSDGGVRAVAPALLPPHQTSFALTVHKAQGSEFDRVALVLAGDETQVMTRELLYTGVTRARREVQIIGKGAAFQAACGRVTRRSSGLRGRLWEKGAR